MVNFTKDITKCNGVLQHKEEVSMQKIRYGKREGKQLRNILHCILQHMNKADQQQHFLKQSLLLAWKFTVRNTDCSSSGQG